MLNQRSNGTFVVQYSYVPDMESRRVAVRQQHLTHVLDAAEKGLLRLAVAFEDPVDGAILLFNASDLSDVLSWTAQDPYVAAGLVRTVTTRSASVACGPGGPPSAPPAVPAT